MSVSNFDMQDTRAHNWNENNSSNRYSIRFLKILTIQPSILHGEFGSNCHRREWLILILPVQYSMWLGWKIKTWQAYVDKKIKDKTVSTVATQHMVSFYQLEFSLMLLTFWSWLINNWFSIKLGVSGFPFGVEQVVQDSAVGKIISRFLTEQRYRKNNNNRKVVKSWQKMPTIFYSLHFLLWL